MLLGQKRVVQHIIFIHEINCQKVRKANCAGKGINGVWDNGKAGKYEKKAMLSTWSYDQLSIIVVKHTQTKRMITLRGKVDMDDYEVFGSGMEMD